MFSKISICWIISLPDNFFVSWRCINKLKPDALGERASFSPRPHCVCMCVFSLDPNYRSVQMIPSANISFFVFHQNFSKLRVRVYASSHRASLKRSMSTESMLERKAPCGRAPPCRTACYGLMGNVVLHRVGKAQGECFSLTLRVDHQ